VDPFESEASQSYDTSRAGDSTSDPGGLDLSRKIDFELSDWSPKVERRLTEAVVERLTAAYRETGAIPVGADRDRIVREAICAAWGEGWLPVLSATQIVPRVRVRHTRPRFESCFFGSTVLSSGSTGKFSGNGAPPPPFSVPFGPTLSFSSECQANSPALAEEPVPSPARGWGEDVDRHVEQREKGISRRHALEIRRVAKKAGRLLEEAGLACRPANFSVRHLDTLLTGAWRPATAEQSGLAARTRAYNVTLLNGVLKAYGNLTIENAHLVFPKSDVRRRDYLKPEAARRLLDAGERRGIEPHSMIAFEMLMGLRRCEVLRIRTVDLDLGLNPDELVVHGSLKGQQGEKIRRVQWHDEVRRVIPELLSHREVVRSGYTGADSGFVYVHRRGGVLRVWSKSFSDRKWMIPAFDDAGVKHPDGLNHVLRRTFGRTLWDNGVKIEAIAYLMGHSDTRVTIRYLGLDQRDGRASMDVLNRVFPALKAI
jgi:integrase